MYQVDAFASDIFKGNPAAVCPLDKWLSDEQMLSIAKENNLSETAFVVSENDGFRIRWFTPNEEIALCGHATLATAHVLFDQMRYSSNEIKFYSQSGELNVRKLEKTLIMDFPALSYTPIESMNSFESLNLKMPVKVFKSSFDLLFVYDSELDVINAEPDLRAVAKLDYRGLILTAPGSKSDVFSRCFYPGCDVPEDPVTGSAHCVLAPYWCERFGKNRIKAKQGGRRQGDLICAVNGNRVLLEGSCHLYLKGTIYLP